MRKKSAHQTEILGGKRRETFFSKRNENDIKKLEKWMLYHLPGPRLTDTLRLSGSEPKLAPQKCVILRLRHPVFWSLSRVGPHCSRRKRSMNVSMNVSCKQKEKTHKNSVKIVKERRRKEKRRKRRKSSKRQTGGRGARQALYTP